MPGEDTAEHPGSQPQSTPACSSSASTLRTRYWTDSTHFLAFWLCVTGKLAFPLWPQRPDLQKDMVGSLKVFLPAQLSSSEAHPGFTRIFPCSHQRPTQHWCHKPLVIRAHHGYKYGETQRLELNRQASRSLLLPLTKLCGPG